MRKLILALALLLFPISAFADHIQVSGTFYLTSPDTFDSFQGLYCEDNLLVVDQTTQITKKMKNCESTPGYDEVNSPTNYALANIVIGSDMLGLLQASNIAAVKTAMGLGAVASSNDFNDLINKPLGVSLPLAESNVTNLVSDLASKASTSHTHAASDIISGTFADARIAQSNVTQHQAALSIASSQVTGTKTNSFISDFASAARALFSGSNGINYNSSTGAFTPSYGSSANTFAQGNDSRFIQTWNQSGQVSNPKIFTGAATVASGNAVVNVTQDNTSGGTAICGTVDYVKAEVSDSAANYNYAYSWGTGNKVLTIGATKASATGVIALLGINLVGAPVTAPNGSSVNVLVHCH